MDKKDGNVVGAVFLCQDCFINSGGKVFEIGGFQYGEKFGYSLCPVDVNGDGYDDLVVGAPFYSANDKVNTYYSLSSIHPMTFVCISIRCHVCLHQFRKEAREQYTFIKMLTSEEHLP